MGEVVIVGGVRTPVGSFGGSLKTTPVVSLGALVLKEALKRLGLRPVASDELKSFEPDALKGTGMIELETNAYDYPDVMPLPIYFGSTPKTPIQALFSRPNPPYTMYAIMYPMILSLCSATKLILSSFSASWAMMARYSSVLGSLVIASRIRAISSASRGCNLRSTISSNLLSPLHPYVFV